MRQCIEAGCLNPLVAVATAMVFAQGIDNYHHQVHHLRFASSFCMIVTEKHGGVNGI
jgi:hypothetical protein